MPKGYPGNGVNTGRFVKGQVPWNKGMTLPQHTPEQIRQISDTCKANGVGKWKIGAIPWNKGLRLPQFSGADHPSWKGGVTAKTRGIRFSADYLAWRRRVFERDNYTCIFCGQIGGTLNADHIKPFMHRPDLIFNINNGRTLCAPCHRKTDTYGTRARNWVDPEEEVLCNQPSQS